MEAFAQCAPIVHRSNPAFEALVLPHYGTLCRSALRLAGSQAEAEDLVQETLLRAYRAHERLTPESQVRPWLMRILYNIAKLRAYAEDKPH